MADTQRTLADLKSILPDNATGEISPQDLRDLVESFAVGHGELYSSATVTTPIVTPGTYVKAANATTLSTAPAAKNWDMPADNRLRYTGTATRLARVSCTLSASISSGANKALSFRLGKNGTPHVDTTVNQFIVVSSQNEALVVSGLFEVVNGDYIELFCTNNTDTVGVDVTSMSMDAISTAT